MPFWQRTLIDTCNQSAHPCSRCFDAASGCGHVDRVNPAWILFRPSRLDRASRSAGWIAAWILTAVLGLAGERPTWIHSGMANASTAIRVGTNQFLTGCDEDNIVKLYRAGVSGGPIAEFDLSRWLEMRGHPAEADIEGAARIDDTIYWIGSHSRARDGRSRPNRERILATRLVEGTNGVTLEKVGHPCTHLLGALLRAPQLTRFHLTDAALKAPEEEGGLNIEGLAATRDGGLLIGFRSPLVNGKALIVPLKNPGTIMTGARPELGDPVLLDLDGLGIRDIVFTGLEYFIVAGGTGHGGTSHLYRWAGGTAVPERVEKAGIRHLNPEGIANFGTAERPRLLIVSDDGNQLTNRKSAPGLRTFRSVWVDP